MSTELITINKNALSTIKDKTLKAELATADKAAANVRNAIQSVDNALKDISRAFGKIVSEKLYEKDGYEHAKDLWEKLEVKESRASQLVGASRLIDVDGIGNRFNIDALYTLASSKIPVETIKTAVENGELPAWSGQTTVKNWVKSKAIESGKPSIVKTYSVHVVVTVYGDSKSASQVYQNDYVNVPMEMFDTSINELALIPLSDGKNVDGIDNWKCKFYQSTDFSGHALVYYRVTEKPDKVAKKSAEKARAAALAEENERMRAALKAAGINF